MVNHDTSSSMLYLQSMYADKFSEFPHPYKVLKIPSFPSDFKAIQKYVSKNCYAQKITSHDSVVHRDNNLFYI